MHKPEPADNNWPETTIRRHSNGIPVTAAVRLSVLAVTLLVATGFTLAGQPADIPTALRPTTVSQLDRALTNAQGVPAQLLARTAVKLVELSGRTPADDYAEYYFTEAVADQVQAIRGELDSRGLAAADTVPYDLHERMERLLRVESCKILRISTYWDTHQGLKYHRDMIVALLARALEPERTWAEPRLKSLDEKAKAMRTSLEAEIASCGTADPWLIPDELRSRDLWAELQGLRGELAVRMDEADNAAGQWRSSQARASPCPVLPVEPSGPTRRIRKAPDVGAHYPQQAIKHSVTGTVRVRIGYDASGCVVEASVHRSSGSDLLDQAAIAAAFDTIIVPELKDGAPASGFAVLPLHFNISDQSKPPPTPATLDSLRQ